MSTWARAGFLGASGWGNRRTSHDDAEPTSFDEHIRRSTLRHSEVLAGMFVVCAVVGWPLDWMQFDGDVQLKTSGAVRLAIAGLNVWALLVTRWLRVSPRLVFPIIAAFAMANAWAVGLLIATAHVGDGSWLPSSYAVPLAMLPLMLPLRHRIALTMGVSAACAAAYATCTPGPITSVTLATLVTLAMVAGMSIALGHMCFLRFRDNFRLRELLSQRVVERTENLRSALAHVDSVQADERRRIGRELHDDLAQSLTALRLEVSMALRTCDADSPHRAMLTRVDGVVDELVDAKRRLLRALRPAILEQVGLGDAIASHAREAAARGDLTLEVEIALGALNVAEPVASTAFRVVQEAMTNVLRHANASAAAVRVHHADDQLVLSVSDNGAGFDPDAVTDSNRVGLLGLRERVSSLGGSVRIESAPGEGTAVSVTLPCIS